ncbi:MAG: Family ership [Fibrobacterota bacterium]|jgi:NAD(P)H dehydrogenase (quinone)
MSASTLLVTGAAGHLGRATLEHLLKAGHTRLVATTRNPDALADFAARGVEIRKADFDDATTLEAAFQGVDRMLLISTSSFDYPGQRLEQHKRAIGAAAAADVKHILYTSVVRADEAESPMILAIDHRATEAALIESGLDYTILRNNWYAENMVGDVQHALATGTLATATGEGKVGWVTRDDCARAAAAALASSFTGKRIVDVTGPEALSFGEIAQILSQVSGKEITFAPLPSSVRQEILVQIGLPAGFAQVLVNSEESIAQGWLATVSSDVETLTGTKATSLAEFLRTLV